MSNAQRDDHAVTDAEWVRELQSTGADVFDGGQNKVPDAALPSIHDVRELTHLGFGNFASSEFVFMRCDSPCGTRFYVRQVHRASAGR